MLLKLIQIKDVSLSPFSFSLRAGCKSFSLTRISCKIKKTGEFFLLHVSYSWVRQLPRALFSPLIWKLSIPLGTIDTELQIAASLLVYKIILNIRVGVRWDGEMKSKVINISYLSWIKSLVNINFVLVFQKYFILWHLTNFLKLWQS